MPVVEVDRVDDVPRSPSSTVIAQDAAEAAQCLWDHSWAMVRLDDAVVSHLQQAKEIAVTTLFVPDQVSANKQQYQVMDRGHLVGFHEPSPAKYLYRALFHSDTTENPCTTLQDHPRQPWHSNTFQRAATEGGSSLHCMLLQILERLVELGLGTVSAVNPNSSRAGRKRKSATIQHNKDIASSIEEKDPQPYLDACPMDFFYYHNRQQQDQPRQEQSPKECSLVVPNCTPHVDRGVLIVVVLTDVPGLVVRSKDENIHCPEMDHATLLQKDEYRLACVLAGGQLEQYMAARLEQERTVHKSGNCISLPPCVHWVKNDLDKPRLSISYELRLQQSSQTDTTPDRKRRVMKTK